MTGLLLLCAVPTWGEEPLSQAEPEQSLDVQIGTKMARGACNLGLGWVEIPKQIYLASQHGGWAAGAFRGPIDGLGMFVARTFAGMYEILTFPIPLPPHYQPLVGPEFVWQPEPPAPEVAGALAAKH
jgi:putative exosortase-associated protein (TIGR04073 family)